MKMEENKRKQLSRRKIEEAFLKELETKSSGADESNREVIFPLGKL